MPERVTAPTRRLIAERAGYRCEYCRTPSGITPSPFSAEHIQSRSAGGSHTQENLVFSCQGCNGHKAAGVNAPDPVTRKSVLLFHPRRQKWNEHFAWTADGTGIEGKSSAGRATVVALQLNRIGLQNLRRLMIIAGIHPSES